MFNAKRIVDAGLDVVAVAADPYEIIPAHNAAVAMLTTVAVTLAAKSGILEKISFKHRLPVNVLNRRKHLRTLEAIRYKLKHIVENRVLLFAQTLIHER